MRSTMRTEVRKMYAIAVLAILSSSSVILGGDAKEKTGLQREPLYEAHGHPHRQYQQHAYTDQRNGRHGQGHYGEHPGHAGHGEEKGGKTYAFAYAVRDGDRGGDDFFHKERREGKVTVGEYSVVLPDGRTQIVKYTSDSKDGYKADVTYEGDDKGENYFKLSSPEKPHDESSASQQPTRSVPPPPRPSGRSLPGLFASRRPPPPPSSYNPSEGPVYLSYPLKARRPSLSPSVIYGGKGSSGLIHDHHGNGVAASPKPTVYTKHSGSPYYPGPTKPGPTYFGPTKYTKVHPTQAVYTSGKPGKYYPSPSPNSLHHHHEAHPTPYAPRPTKYTAVLEKATHPTSPYEPGQGSPYKPIQRGQRAGPDHPPNPSNGPHPPRYHDPSPSYAPHPPRHHEPSPSYAPHPPRHQDPSPSYAPTSHRHHEPNPTYSSYPGRQYEPHPSYAPHSQRHQEPHPSYAPVQSQDSYVHRSPPQQFVASPSDRVADRYTKTNHGHDSAYSDHLHLGGKSKLVPIEYFKAGPASTPAYEERKSNGPVYNLVASPSPAGPSYAPHIRTQQQPQQYFDTNDAIHPTQHYSSSSQLIHLPSSEQIYFAQKRKLQENNVPNVKSSVATYTSDYLGATGKPFNYESSTSPGVPVGRPVRPSTSGLVYLTNPAQYDDPSRGPGPSHEGIRATLSRLPSLSANPTASAPVHPYEIGRPDFGGSVAYGNGPPRSPGPSEGPQSLGQEYHEHGHPNQIQDNNVLRRYVVEKRVE